MISHQTFMKRCLELASLGISNVAPNPMVGSVIVYNNLIIGESYHQQYGKSHAEVNAINSVKDQLLLSKSTLYVNLEPCAHYGKTPPCANLIVEKKIPKVVIGCKDTFSKVAGKGIEHMQNNGVEVICGILENESREINRRFFTYHEKKRPYIILKWAQTTDGFIDKVREKNALIQPTWISDTISKMLVHRWRTEEQSILIATNTAVNDNPKLDSRFCYGKNPLRLLIDRNLRVPAHYNLLDNTIKTIVFTEKKAENKENLEYVTLTFNDRLIEQILDYIWQRQIISVIVEGGSTLFNSFVTQNLWDEARLFIGSQLFGSGIKAPEIHGKTVFNKSMGEGRQIVLVNRND